MDTEAVIAYIKRHGKRSPEETNGNHGFPYYNLQIYLKGAFAETIKDVEGANEENLFKLVQDHVCEWKLGDFTDEFFKDAKFAPYRHVYTSYFEKIYDKISRLYSYSIVENPDRGVLNIDVLGEAGTGAIVDGMISRGKDYVDQFLSASELQAAAMLKHDKVPQVFFKP